jgi:hypothetical protein
MRLTHLGAQVFMLLLLLNVYSAHAVSLSVQQELAGPHLTGQGGYRWLGFKIYDAFLWRESGVENKVAVMDSKFILEIIYARELRGKRIATVSIDEMRKLNIGTSEQQSAWLQLMLDTFPDVREGSRLSGVYLPGQGIRFYHDGRLLKEISDVEFARAFFSIWLDEHTSAQRLRSQLLGLTP